jgi:Zn finger protein HypA/HybF involved in hydrogenase expression
MAGPSIQNCQRCGIVFRSTTGGDKCPTCASLEFEYFQRVYDCLQRAGEKGAAIDDISRTLNIPQDEILALFESGKLGIAANVLKTYCQGCNMLMSALQRVGKYCQQCAAQTAEAAGVEIKSRQQLEREAAEAQKREDHRKLLMAPKPPALPGTEPQAAPSIRQAQYGFRRQQS